MYGSKLVLILNETSQVNQHGHQFQVPTAVISRHVKSMLSYGTKDLRKETCSYEMEGKW